jgi:hypothetical protein
MGRRRGWGRGDRGRDGVALGLDQRRVVRRARGRVEQHLGRLVERAEPAVGGVEVGDAGTPGGPDLVGVGGRVDAEDVVPAGSGANGCPPEDSVLGAEVGVGSPLGAGVGDPLGSRVTPCPVTGAKSSTSHSPEILTRLTRTRNGAGSVSMRWSARLPLPG